MFIPGFLANVKSCTCKRKSGLIERRPGLVTNMPHTIYSGCNLKCTWEMQTKADLLWYYQSLSTTASIYERLNLPIHTELYLQSKMDFDANLNGSFQH